MAGWIHRGAAVAAQFHASASSEYFLLEDKEGWDVEKIKAWYKLTVTAFQMRYPDQIAQVRLDLDEQTPHLAIVTLPIYIKKTKHTTQTRVSYRKVFGGHRDTASERMTELQDWYAEAMKPLGLVRGEPAAETERKHQPHQAYRRTEQAKAKRTLAALEAAERREREAEEQMAALAKRHEAIDKERQLLSLGTRRIVDLLLDGGIAIDSAGSISVRPDEWDTVRPAMTLMAPIVRQVCDLREAMWTRLDELELALAEVRRISAELSPGQEAAIAEISESLGLG